MSDQVLSNYTKIAEEAPRQLSLMYELPLGNAIRVRRGKEELKVAQNIPRCGRVVLDKREKTVDRIVWSWCYIEVEYSSSLSQHEGRKTTLPCRNSYTEIGKKAWLFAKLKPGRARKRINTT